MSDSHATIRGWYSKEKELNHISNELRYPPNRSYKLTEYHTQREQELTNAKYVMHFISASNAAIFRIMSSAGPYGFIATTLVLGAGKLASTLINNQIDTHQAYLNEINDFGGKAFEYNMWKHGLYQEYVAPDRVHIEYFWDNIADDLIFNDPAYEFNFYNWEGIYNETIFDPIIPYSFEDSRAFFGSGMPNWWGRLGLI